MRRSRLIDRTGQRFGRLVVVRYHGSKPARSGSRSTRAFWVCACDCGNETVVAATSLAEGHTTSCGCVLAAIRKVVNVTHGQSRTPEYKAWLHIKDRALNENCPAAANYSSRGIGIHPEWAESFESFYAHIGPRPTPSHSVDRIDNNKGYVPGNVRWATARQQGRNRRKTLFATIDGKTRPVIEWCEIYNLKPSTVRSRLAAGWDVLRALSTPTRKVRS